MITDMTQGKPFQVLWRFTIPMLVSVMFQQFYNIVDSIVAGKFVGVGALAAVGASYPITMIFMAVATGLNIGCSVVISLYFGAREYGKMKCCVSTSLISTLGIAVFLSGCGFLFSRPYFSVSLQYMYRCIYRSGRFQDTPVFIDHFITGEYCP